MSPPESASAAAPAVDAPVPAAAPTSPTTAAVEVPWRWVLPLAALPCVIAVLQLGRIHPDEVYQVLEPAWWRAHGYGVLAWEWQVGLRNWSLPGLYGALLRLCAALGIDDPRAYRAVLALPQLGLHIATLAAVHRYAARRGGPDGGALALALIGLHGAVLTFAGRTMSESFSTSFLVLAVEWLDRPGTANEVRRWGLSAGAALGLAVVARYGSAVMVLAALLWLAVRQDWRPAAWTCLSGGAVALALGALDWVTWGAPFHSLRAYLDFNLFSGQAAAQFGSAPATFYLPVLLAQLPLWAWVGLPFSFRGEANRPVPLPLTAAFLYLAAVSVTAHKEERFLYPAVVLLALAAAPGLARLFTEKLAPKLRAPVTLLAVAASVASLAFQPDLRGDEFRAIVRASREATGMLIVGDGLWGVGGYFYLGKNIPWATCDFAHEPRFRAAMADPRVNRVVTYDDHALPELQAAGFREVDRVGKQQVLAREAPAPSP